MEEITRITINRFESKNWVSPDGKTVLVNAPYYLIEHALKTYHGFVSEDNDSEEAKADAAIEAEIKKELAALEAKPR